MRWRARSSAALLLVAAGCVSSAPAPLTPALSARARLLRIEDTRRDEAAYLDSLLAGTDPRLRADAVLAAGRIGARSHVAQLRRLAADADTGVAANALFALGLLKDSGAVDIASRALRAGMPQAAEAAFLLGELGDRGRDVIVSALADATVPNATRGALLLASARLRPVPAAAVVPFLGSQDSAVAWRAAYAIARGRSAAGTRALLGAATSPWSAVREQVARGAARSITGDSLAAIARDALVRLIADTSARVRVNAVRALASHGSAHTPLVLAALRDGDPGVRVQAAQSLEPLLAGDTEAWRAAFNTDTAFAVRRSLADGAIRHGLDLAARAAWGTSGDWRLRAAAVELAARGPAATAFKQVDAFSMDADGRVRAAAASALAQLADSAAPRVEVRARLRSLLTDSDIGVRSASLGGLTRGATGDDLAAALVAYRRSLGDGDNDARLAFWRLADTVLSHKPPLADSVERALGALVKPSEPLERLAAARVLRFSAWGDSSGTSRPMGWYEERVREALSTRVLVIETERGVMELRLFSAEAPLTVYNIVSLARRGYFDGQRFHRVVPNFVIQAGDPRGDGNGGPGYAIRDELNRRRYLRGTLGMALSGPNTGGSQFFVTHSPQPHLDAGYTVFGELVQGGDVLDRIIQGDRIVRITVR